MSVPVSRYAAQSGTTSALKVSTAGQVPLRERAVVPGRSRRKRRSPPRGIKSRGSARNPCRGQRPMPVPGMRHRSAIFLGNALIGWAGVPELHEPDQHARAASAALGFDRPMPPAGRIVESAGTSRVPARRLDRMGQTCSEFCHGRRGPATGRSFRWLPGRHVRPDAVAICLTADTHSG